ncbi:hypothetical protein Yalta_146 [Yalta virus]|nr:hypothetical protein Yalta_146 [Yalta virus]
MDYSYLFDSEKIYSENIISFYNLFSKDNIYEFISPRITENNFFLYHVYPNHSVVKQLLERDELMRFRFIDFFENNVNMIEQRDRKIQEFLLKNDINYLNNIHRFLKKDIDVVKLNSLKPVIEDISSNKEIYLYYILSQTWSDDPYKVVNIEYLTIRLLILYYFNIFMIKDRSQKLNIDSPDYIDFLKLLVRYQSLFNINEDFTSIIFRSNIEEQEDVFYFRENENMRNNEPLDDVKKMILRFFLNLTNPVLINKKVITWFYIFFSSYIPSELHNQLLYIILEFKKNTIGLITQIIKSYNKDYNSFTEEEKMDIAERIQSDYVFKQNEQIANIQDIRNYMNNIFLLANYGNDSNFSLLTDIDISSLIPERLFFILCYDPLKESWSGVEKKIQQVEYKFRDMDIQIQRLIQIFNSLQMTNFNNKNINIITSDGRYRNVSFFTIVEKLNTFDNMHRVVDIEFDQDILFYNFLLFLNNFEIILFNAENSIIESVAAYNTDINTIKQIFHSIYPQKDFYNGYKRFK